jgi:hypothetical protein
MKYTMPSLSLSLSFSFFLNVAPCLPLLVAYCHAKIMNKAPPAIFGRINDGDGDLSVVRGASDYPARLRPPPPGFAYYPPKQILLLSCFAAVPLPPTNLLYCIQSGAPAL